MNPYLGGVVHEGDGGALAIEVDDGEDAFGEAGRCDALADPVDKEDEVAVRGPGECPTVPLRISVVGIFICKMRKAVTSFIPHFKPPLQLLPNCRLKCKLRRNCTFSFS